MKRELAALVSDVAGSDSNNGVKTRSSKFQRSGSPRLVYKRVRRSSVSKAIEEREGIIISSNNNVLGERKESEKEERESVSANVGERKECEALEVGERKEEREVSMVEVVMSEGGERKEYEEEEKQLALVPVDLVENNNDGGEGTVCLVEDMEEFMPVDVEGMPLSEGLKVKRKRKEKTVPPEGYSRRFTRSALKVKEEEEEDGSVVLSDDIVSVVVNECRDIVVRDEENEEENVSRRFTRSHLKAEVDDSSEVMESVEEPGISDESAEENVDQSLSLSATPKRKLEMKMSKHISLAKIPTTCRELFETGLLEGCPVHYGGGKGLELRGRIRGFGIMCYCDLCQGQKVIPPSLFEIHARNEYKRAVEYIFLENGRSLIQILKACRGRRLSTLEATVENAIGPVPDRMLVVCQNCKETFSTMDDESSDPVCSFCVMSNLSPIGPVYSARRICSAAHNKSLKAVAQLKSSVAASLCNVLPDRSRGISAENSPEVRRKKMSRSSLKFGKSSEAKKKNTIMQSPQETPLSPRSRSTPRMENPSGAKICKKPMKKSSNEAFTPKRSGSVGLVKSLKENGLVKRVRRLSNEVPTPISSPAVCGSSDKKTSGKITRKDLGLHKLVFGEDGLPEGTVLGYYARGQKLLDGFKKGSGIFCRCCDSVVSASQFEAHAGCATRRKPYQYIYTSNGVSLHEFSVNLRLESANSTKLNDDLCSICSDGGSLVLCDGCPRAFHKECTSLKSIPRGKWYCGYCQSMFDRENFVAYNANAFAAGRVSGVDSMEQISRRSIRIVNNVAPEVSACILCRGSDFCKSGFGARTIILCDQCEKEYHVGCLKDHNMADLKELPDGKWFCSADCGRIDSALQNLLVRGAELLPESLVNIIRKKQTGKDSEPEFDVCWRLLSGKIASPETRLLLSQAVAIFHESFAPIIDVVSGHDLIPAMVYGRNVAGQEYGGMYCAVLTVNSVVVSAGIFRVFGPGVAELPLVATRSNNQGKGYFQTLFACIERLLAFLKVKSFVLPAAEEAGSIWTDRFGFTKMTLQQLHELKRNYWSLVRFQGTSMLHKLVPECRVIQSQAECTLN